MYFLTWVDILLTMIAFFRIIYLSLSLSVLGRDAAIILLFDLHWVKLLLIGIIMILCMSFKFIFVLHLMACSSRIDQFSFTQYIFIYICSMSNEYICYVSGKLYKYKADRLLWMKIAVYCFEHSKWRSLRSFALYPTLKQNSISVDLITKFNGNIHKIYIQSK